MNSVTCKAKRYLGDGVYAGFDGYQIWLYTQEGNEIAIESEVLHALEAYVARLKTAIYAGPLPENM